MIYTLGESRETGVEQVITPHQPLKLWSRIMIPCLEDFRQSPQSAGPALSEFSRPRAVTFEEKFCLLAIKGSSAVWKKAGPAWPGLACQMPVAFPQADANICAVWSVRLLARSHLPTRNLLGHSTTTIRLNFGFYGTILRLVYSSTGSMDQFTFKPRTRNHGPSFRQEHDGKPLPHVFYG